MSMVDWLHLEEAIDIQSMKISVWVFKIQNKFANGKFWFFKG